MVKIIKAVKLACFKEHFAIFLSVLLFFISTSYIKESRSVNEINTLSQHLTVAFAVSDLIIELQRERGLIVGYTSGTHEQSKLIDVKQQIQYTNQSDRKYQEVLKEFYQQIDTNLIKAPNLIQFTDLLKKRQENLASSHFDEQQAHKEKEHSSHHSFDKAEQLITFYTVLVNKGLEFIQTINNYITIRDVAYLYDLYITIQNIQEFEHCNVDFQLGHCTDI